MKDGIGFLIYTLKIDEMQGKMALAFEGINAEHGKVMKVDDTIFLFSAFISLSNESTLQGRIDPTDEQKFGMSESPSEKYGISRVCFSGGARERQVSVYFQRDPTVDTLVKIFGERMFNLDLVHGYQHVTVNILAENAEFPEETLKQLYDAFPGAEISFQTDYSKHRSDRVKALDREAREIIRDINEGTASVA